MIQKTDKAMFWTDISFKAKDIILIVGYLLLGVFFVSNIKSSQERLGDKMTELQAEVSEMKDDGKGSTKESQVFLQSMQNQINLTNTQVKLLEQRVDMFEDKFRVN